MKDVLHCPDNCEYLIQHVRIEFFCDKYNAKLENSSLNPERCFICRNKHESKSATADKNS